MDVVTAPVTTRTDAALRWLPLSGLAYAGLQIAGDLTIGPFPGGETSTDKLTSFYAAHHANVAAGGRLLELSAVFLALFGVAIWAMTRRSAPVIAVVTLVGGAMSAMDTATSGATYGFLGDLGVQRNVTPQALQAWHVVGAGFGIDAGTILFLLGVAAAGILVRALPAWLAWTGLVLAVAQESPFGFLASMVFLLWCAVAGIALAVRAGRAARIDVNTG